VFSNPPAQEQVILDTIEGKGWGEACGGKRGAAAEERQCSATRLRRSR